MKIDNEFTVSAPIERAWEILNNIPLIAPCMPGAVLTGSEGDTHEGRVRIKVGPVTSEYKGKATFIEKDEAARRLVIKGEGRDTRGAGNANADITLQMTPEGDNTRISVDTDLKITGKVAQFGRGVIVDISQKLLGQFVDCLEVKIATVEEDASRIADAGAAEAAAGVAAAGAATAGSMGIGKESSGDVESAPEDHATQCWPAGSPEAADAAPAEEPEALDLMDIAGGAVYKRLIPVAIVAVIVLAIIAWVVLG